MAPLVGQVGLLLIGSDLSALTMQWAIEHLVGHRSFFLNFKSINNFYLSNYLLEYSEALTLILDRFD
jgi:hypothetical protein